MGERLEKGLLDFGIMIEPSDMKKYDYLKLPVTDVWGVLMRRDSPLAQKETVRAEDFWGVPLLLSRQALGKSRLSDWLERGYDSLCVAATYNLIFNASLMVEEGLG